MAKGTGALLVLLAAREAIQGGGQQCYIGMGSREAGALRFWTSIGFDMTSVTTSSQPVLLTTVEANASTRVNADGWQKSVEKKGCFLSSACAAARGLPDDCAELTVLRRFRENVLAGSPEGEALLAEYADLAPRIVAAIDGRTDALAVYERTFAEISLCVREIEAAESTAALARYRRLVGDLAREML